MTRRTATTTRRTVLKTLGAVGAAAAGATVAGAQEDLAVDADNLVPGNDTFTVTLPELDAGEVSEPTVNVGGVSFANVESLGDERAILGINVSNVLESDAVAGRDAVTVEVSAVVNGTRLHGTDESFVVSQ